MKTNLKNRIIQLKEKISQAFAIKEIKYQLSPEVLETQILEICQGELFSTKALVVNHGKLFSF